MITSMLNIALLRIQAYQLPVWCSAPLPTCTRATLQWSLKCGATPSSSDTASFT